MAEFPEKENLDTQEFSTVFSDPNEHKDKKVKPKKVLPKIIAGVVCIGILIGSTIAIVQLIPKLEDDNVDVNINSFNVITMESDNISTVDIKNTNGTSTLYSTVVDKTSGEDIDWCVKDIDPELTKATQVENIVKALTNINAIRDIDAKTAEECGFNTPSLSAVVTPKKDDAYTVLIGSKSPDNSGYYLKIENQDKIYLVSNDLYDQLQFDVLDFANTDNIVGFDTNDKSLADYYSDSGLTQFDKLLIRGSKFASEIEMVYSEDSQIYSYVVTRPEKRWGQNMDGLMELYYYGIQVEGAYAYDVSADSLKKVGLDKPDVETVMHLGDTNVTFKFALQKDGYYAVVSDSSRMIHKVTENTVADAIGYDADDFYVSVLFSEHIDEVANFTVKTPEKTFSFDVVKNEESEDGKSPAEPYTVTVDSRTVKCDSFQNLYMECISLKTKDFIQDNLTGEPEITIIVTRNNGKKTNVEFIKANATRYQCEVDGINMGRVTATSLDKVLRDAEKVANNEVVTSNW